MTPSTDDSNHAADEAGMIHFRRLDLHDSMLRDVRTIREDELDVVIVTIHLMTRGYPDYSFAPADLIFSDCEYFAARIDFAMNSACRGAIFESNCEPVMPEQRSDTERPMIRFLIELCPPSGKLEIIARRFELRMPGSREGS
jgi:hypothetical protein